MIATLEGVVSEKRADVVVLVVNGIGYGLLMPVAAQGSLSIGSPAKVYIYEHIREAGYDLFGFTSLDDQQFFELLLSVNGVGPKMALSIINVGDTKAVRSAIASGDVRYIQQANGVGKRVAERLVVELKDKVGLVGVDLSDTGLLMSDVSASQDEAVQALVALGYDVSDATRALKDVDEKLPTEARIREALKVQK